MGLWVSTHTGSLAMLSPTGRLPQDPDPWICPPHLGEDLPWWRVRWPLSGPPVHAAL